jgi:hypothetical protein
MTYDADANADSVADLLDFLQLKQRRRRSNRQEALPTIKMLIGAWYVDELGVMTREIRARE